MKKSVAAVVLTLGLYASPSLGGHRGAVDLLPSGPGVILPIQDRTGSPDTVTFLELLVRQEISRVGSLSEPKDLRATLRRLRIRELTASSPGELGQVAGALDVGWFLSTTLHELVREPVPQVTLSAQLLRPGSAILDWSGFVSLTGVDRETWLGLGRVDSLDDLLRNATVQLFQDLTSNTSDSAKGRLKASRSGFLLHPVLPDSRTVVAVIPFYSVEDHGPIASAELQTRACFMALGRAGFTVALPGAVREVMRQGGRLLFGDVDRTTGNELRTQLGVDWILTGTVETYRSGSGHQPDPWVAIGARMIRSDTGQIVWMDGLERRGSDSDTLFQKGRIYSAADLSLEMTHSLVAGFSGSKRRN